MLAFRIDMSKAQKMLGGVEARARDSKGILRRWMGYMRKKAKDRFAELGGPPLAPSTQRRYEQTRTSSVTAHGEVRKSYAQNLERYYRVKHRDKETRQLTDRGRELVAELRRLSAGGNPSRSTLEAEDKAIARLRQRLEKAQTTRRRVGGDRRKSDKHQLLGRLRTSLEGFTTALSAILRNRVPWSGVHNEGGTAGHRASIPQRTTLQILAEDVAELAKIEVQHLLGIRGK